MSITKYTEMNYVGNKASNLPPDLKRSCATSNFHGMFFLLLNFQNMLINLQFCLIVNVIYTFR